jgi:signal transduction histidine kinase/HPt (histidine-containing phosphotransfer) domain-containing protein
LNSMRKEALHVGHFQKLVQACFVHHRHAYCALGCVLLCSVVSGYGHEGAAVQFLFYTAILGSAHTSFFKAEVAMKIFHGLANILPLLSAIEITFQITYTNCGGTCDAMIWMPKLRLVAIMPFLWGTLFQLPFWRYFFWFRMLSVMLTIISWQWIQRTNGIELPFKETVAIALLALVCAWEREQTGKALFRSQHAESTAIIGCVSHDLRTPLAILRTNISFLQSPKLQSYSLSDPKIQAHLANADHSGKRMDGLVEDLLLASTLYNTDGTALLLTQNTVHIRPFLEQLVSHLQYRINKGVTSTMKVDALVPSAILIDENRLSQIVTNLLTNSAKFTQRGTIHLRCALVESQKDNTVLKIEVQDSGIGIGAAGCKKLKMFTLFNKLRNSESDRLNASGTGIGLSICHKLAQTLGGKLEFTSSPGLGSLFWFTMQVLVPPVKIDTDISAEVKGGTTEIDQVPILPSLHLLLVDDDELIRGCVQMMLELERADICITEATNGSEALTILRSGKEFSCILMDCNMAIMDGYECTRQIRLREKTRQIRRTPIIGHTANADAAVVSACMMAGMDMVLPKGQRSSSFFRALAELGLRVGVTIPAPSSGGVGVGVDSGDVGSSVHAISPSCGTQLPRPVTSDSTAADTPAWGWAKDGRPPVALGIGIFTMGSREIYLRLLHQFKERLPAILCSIREAYEARDMARIEREAHSLKGGAAYAHAQVLVDAANALQHVAAASGGASSGVLHMEQLSAVHTAFHEEASCVMSYLEQHL